MSIKKIAAIAGVSTATVSRVLNNPDYKCSSGGLREKIWQIAREMNYMPNEAARNLKMGKSTTKDTMYYLDILMTRTGNNQEDPFFSELLRIIESQIHKRSCILVSLWHQPVFYNERKCRLENTDCIIADMMAEKQQNSDGLIILGKCEPQVLKKLSSYYKGIVSVNRNSTNYQVDEVICDGRRIAAKALEYLISLGHRKIGYAVMEKLIQSENPPTAIYCANDLIAIGMLKYMCANVYMENDKNEKKIVTKTEKMFYLCKDYINSIKLD